MASVRLTTWRGIPVLVTASAPPDEVTLSLGAGFQDLVDRVAVQEGLTDTDAYLAGWRVEESTDRAGPPAEVAAAVARELTAQLERLRAEHLGGSGPTPASGESSGTV